MSRHWRAHPGVRSGSDLTWGERAADKMRDLMASWAFIIGSLAWMGVWITVAKLRLAPIDNPQLTYLNLGLSCFAALASSIILLAAKRQDKISGEVALHALGNTATLMDLSQQILALNQRQMEILSALHHLNAELDLARTARGEANPEPAEPDCA